MWSASTVPEVTLTQHYVNRFLCVCPSSATNNVVLPSSPLLPTAACAPGSRGSRPVLPVAWMFSGHLTTIRLQPLPRPRPLLQQPPPTLLQPHLPTVTIQLQSFYLYSQNMKPTDIQIICSPEQMS